MSAEPRGGRRLACLWHAELQGTAFPTADGTDYTNQTSGREGRVRRHQRHSGTREQGRPTGSQIVPCAVLRGDSRLRPTWFQLRRTRILCHAGEAMAPVSLCRPKDESDAVLNPVILSQLSDSSTLSLSFLAQEPARAWVWNCESLFFCADTFGATVGSLPRSGGRRTNGGWRRRQTPSFSMVAACANGTWVAWGSSVRTGQPRDPVQEIVLSLEQAAFASGSQPIHS